MIKTWEVICDRCGKEINAIKESFIERDEEQLCNECANDEEPKMRTYIVKWMGFISGTQKVNATDRFQAMRKADEKPDIEKDDVPTTWHIDKVTEDNSKNVCDRV